MPALVKEGFNALISTTERQSAWPQVAQIFSACSAVSSANDIWNLYYHLSAAYEFMAELDYPEPADFLEPMPAWPVKEAVKPFTDISEQAEPAGTDELTTREAQLLSAIAESTNVYFNYTGQYPCTNLSDASGEGNLDGYGWNCLACNQLAMPIGFGPDSMFYD